MKGIWWRTLLWVFLLIGVLSCSYRAAPSVATKQRHENIRRQQMENAGNLAEYLRTQPGVIVSGHFGNYTIRIQAGANTLESGTEPLFIVDGMPFNSSFNELVNFVNMKDVDRVQILKDATSMASYGSRGANGIIQIYMKK